MELAERLKFALEVLSSDTQAGGSLREQASNSIGMPVDDEALNYLNKTSVIIYNHTVAQAAKHGFPQEMGHEAALCNVLIAGLAVGKRMGIEDGESFARQVSNVD